MQFQSITRSRLALSMAVASVVVAAPAAFAADIFWTGSAGDGKWSTPANWSTGAVPGSADIAWISPAATLPTDMDLVGATIQRVYYLGTDPLTVTGNELATRRIASRHGRNVTFTTGATTAQVLGTLGVQGLYVGMPFAGDGIPSGTAITAIDTNTNVITFSKPTTGSATNSSRSFDASADLTWNGNINLTHVEGWQVASGRTLTVNGNISGAGGISGNVDGTLALKGTNSYTGETHSNTGTIYFYGPQAVSPSSVLSTSFGTLRFGSTSGSGDFRYSIANTLASGSGGPTHMVDGGGRLILDGNLSERGTGVRGFRFNRGGSGNAIVELEGQMMFRGGLSLNSPVLFRMHNAPGVAYGGNTDITSSTDRSELDGTLDLMGNPYDRKIGSNNSGGVLSGGNLVNSSLSSPSIVSSMFNNMGTSSGNRDFGGPGTIILTGALRLTGSTTDTGLQKVGPGAVIVRNTAFTHVAADNNPNDIFNGTLVLDHAANNTQKISSDQLQMQNGRLVVLGNDFAPTTVNVGNLAIGGAGDRGYAQVDVRSGSGAPTAFTFATLTTLSDVEVVDFSTSDGGGGMPGIHTNHAAGILGANVTFNQSQWAQVSGGQVVGYAAEVAASDAASFAGTGYARNLEVTNSFETSAVSEARTLRFSEAAGNTLTLGAALRLNLNNSGGGTGSGILVAPGTGAVTIDGTSSLELGTNTALAIHQHAAQPLTLAARITGGSGTELTKVGTGELILSRTDSTWGSGATNSTAIAIYEGKVTVSSIANYGTNSSLGLSGIIAMGARNNVNLSTGVATQAPAILNYVGTGDTTNRTITLTGVAELQANGTGLLDWTNTGTTVSSMGNSGAWNDLILSGSGAGRFNGLVDLGHGNLTKKGSGTWTLSSTASLNTYGKLVLDEGTFVNDGVVSLHTDVLVSGGTLAGSGTTRGQISIIEGGAISPGNSAGTMTVGDIDLDGALIAELLGSAAGQYDQLIVNGNVALGDASDLQLSIGYLPADGDSFTLILNNGASAISGVFATVNGSAVTDNTFGLGDYSVTLNYAGGDGNDLVAVLAVPEPTAAGVLLLVSTASLARRRRK